jgi:NTP pyrophosphatase (non-canonical NTP hydrolase)
MSAEVEQRFADTVVRLVKSGGDIAKDITPHEAHMLHMVSGISGEAGELLDAVKKVVVYRKPIDIENVIEELGDLEFYMQGLRSALGIDRIDTLERNMEKLNRRYGTGYSDEAAQVRADKSEE